MPQMTQEERRTATRRALLDAALQTLVEQGYAATTTTEVVRRAGLSQGALFRHFPTKADLLGAVIEDTYPDLVGEYVTAIAEDLAGAAGADPAVLGRRVMVQLVAAMRRPETLAALELLGAARTDLALAARLAPVEAAHRQAMRDHAAALFPSVPDPQRRDRAVDVALDLAIGLAQTSAIADADRVDGQLDLAGELLASVLMVDAPTPDAP